MGSMRRSRCSYCGAPQKDISLRLVVVFAGVVVGVVGDVLLPVGARVQGARGDVKFAQDVRADPAHRSGLAADPDLAASVRRRQLASGSEQLVAGCAGL